MLLLLSFSRMNENKIHSWNKFYYRILFLPTFKERSSFENNFLIEIFSNENLCVSYFDHSLSIHNLNCHINESMTVVTSASSPVFRVGQIYLLTTNRCFVMQRRIKSGNLRKAWPVYPGNLTAWHWCFGVQSGRDMAWPCAVFLATFLYRRQREKTFQFYIYIKVIYIKRQTPRCIRRGSLFVW